MPGVGVLEGLRLVMGLWSQGLGLLGGSGWGWAPLRRLLTRDQTLSWSFKAGSPITFKRAAAAVRGVEIDPK